MFLIAAPMQLLKHMLEWGLDGVVSPLESCVRLISLPLNIQGLLALWERRKPFAECQFKSKREQTVFQSFLILRYSSLDWAVN